MLARGGVFSWNVLWQHILSNHRCWPKGVQARETRGQTVTCKSIGQWVHLLFTMVLSGSKDTWMISSDKENPTFGDVSPKMLQISHEMISSSLLRHEMMLCCNQRERCRALRSELLDLESRTSWALVKRDEGGDRRRNLLPLPGFENWLTEFFFL